MNHKVLVIEDRSEIAHRLEVSISETDGLIVCGKASDVDEGLSLLYKTKPRIALVDLGLPDGSGIEIIKAVMLADWECDALVISIFGDEMRVIEALQAGAKGYILKGGGKVAIGQDILSVINGGSPISPQIARHLLSMIKIGNIQSQLAGVEIVLTKRETEVLNAVSKGYKRHEIAERLGISTGTVGTHINKVYQKLNVGSNTEAIAYATRMGLL